MRQVVDASVVLAYLLGEPGGIVLRDEEGPFCLSQVNLAEVLTKIVDRQIAVDDVLRVLKRLPIEQHDYLLDDARRTARLRAGTRKAGLSLGDRACLALAERLDLPVLTANTAWQTLDLGIDIRLIR